MELDVRIRPMQDMDAEDVSQAFTAQGWYKPAEQYHRYLRDGRDGKRLVLLAELAGEFAGYATVVWAPDYPPFRAAGIPEISDFNVLKRLQRRGIGSMLMDAAERAIAERSSIAGIGVGMTRDYGAAQILYVKRGYIPDGLGLFQNDKHLQYEDRVTVDDDLVLYFTRQLRKSG